MPLALAVAVGATASVAAPAEPPADPAIARPASGASVEQAERPLFVRRFVVDGGAALDEAALQRLLAPYTGRRLALGELRRAVEALAEHVRTRGHPAARVSLPPQTIRDGVVRLRVRHDEAVAPVAPHVALAPRLDLSLPATATAEAQEPQADREQETTARRAPAPRFYAELPSSRPRATVVGNEKRPAERLIVELAEGEHQSLGPDGDLFATPPRDWRLGASLDFANPAGRGGHLNARAVAAAGGTPYVSGRFDAPLDVAASTLASDGRYLDDGIAEELNALGAEGRTRAFELAAERPLRTRPGFDLALRTRLRQLERHDEAGGATTAHRLTRSAQLGARGRLEDGLLGGGRSAASLSATLGLTELDGFAPYARSDAAGPGTAGAFGRVRASVARLQQLGGPWALFGALSAQGASKNLDGSQRFSIGGIAPERGFAVGEAAGDEGFRLNADLRYAVPRPLLGGRLSFALFYDQGGLRLRRDPAEGAGNTLDHRALGLTLRQDWSDLGFLQVSAGRRFGSSLAEGQDPKRRTPYRFWLHLGLTF